MMTETMPNYPDLAGRVAFVSGGSRGIGAETARALAANGVRVAVNGRDVVALDGVVSQIRAAGGEAIAVVADCTDSSELAAAAQTVVSTFGAPDILMAFAGAGSPIPTLELNEETWHHVIDTNLTATLLTVQAFLPAMIERGSGAIVTMSSTSGRLPSQASVAYGAAKAGIVMFTRHIANEFAAKGVRVNCVAPSAILTERNLERMPPAVREQVSAMHPLGRIGTPHDVANAALFLASDASSWITGITLDVAGGRVMI